MNLTRTLAVGLFAGMILASPAVAAEKTALTPGIVEQLDLASKLTNYGIARNDPLLLLAAARLITTAAPESAASAAPTAPADLIEKAKAMAKDDKAIETLAEAIGDEASRGLCYGPGTVYGCF